MNATTHDVKGAPQMPTTEHSPRSVVSAAVDVVVDLQRRGRDHEPVAARLRDSVIGPFD